MFLLVPFSNLIPAFFYLLFFTVPIILYPYTSELFEFNKMVFTYLITVLIATSWIIKMILNKKMVFTKTPLDIPIILFLTGQILSTLVSIDPRSSVFGYYSRFNGGLLSYLCYAVLYWAYVSNMDREKTIKVLALTFSSAILVSLWGILEHFGIDKNLWVQDVQERVFSTLGQPNWLAAWVVALLPVAWARTLLGNKDGLSLKNITNYILVSILFLTLLYTKSRSGMIGLTFGTFVFVFLILLSKTRAGKTKPLALAALISLILVSLVGTPWTKSIYNLFSKEAKEVKVVNQQAPLLEVGGTASSEIRKIVWRGATKIWKENPILGTGPETFAFSYYKARPVEHNMVSEWEFLYNKAHNEYLNYAANSGTVGLLTYLALIGVSLLVFIKSIINPLEKPELRFLNIGLASGYVSVLVTNFFGFSVVPVALLFFLFPAFSLTLFKDQRKEEVQASKKGLDVPALVTLIIGLFLLYSIIRYWYADLNYAQGKLANSQGNPRLALQKLGKAISFSPGEANYHDEIAKTLAQQTVIAFEAKNLEDGNKLANLAINESNKAISLSGRNVNIWKDRTNIFLSFSEINSSFLEDARNSLIRLTQIAPTDAKIFYNLALVEARMGRRDEAIKILKEAVGMKSNYKDARYALSVLYNDTGNKNAARDELKYILQNISPEDEFIKSQLSELGQ